MEVKGTLEEAGQITDWNGNKYQWGKIQGCEVRFINQDNSSLIGREVHFVDRSNEQNSIQIKKKKDGSEYAAIGGGKHVELWVDGQAVSKIPAGQGAQANDGGEKAWSTQSSGAKAWDNPKKSAQSARPETCYADRIAYGMSAVKMAITELGVEGIPLENMMDSPLLAAVFNSSMYAYRDDVPLHNPVAQAANTLGAAPDEEDDEDDDIPY